MVKLIHRFKEISNQYKAIFCDLWGCLHDGQNSFPESLDALDRFRKQGGTVILLTNAPRPKKNVINLIKNNIIIDNTNLCDIDVITLNNNPPIINRSSLYYPPYYSSDDSDFIDISSDISSEDDSDLSSSSETPIQDTTTREQIHNNDISNFTTYAPFFRTSKSI